MPSKKTKGSVPAPDPKPPRFTREQLLRSARFQDKRDALSVALKDKTYTLDEAQKALDNFMNRKER